MASLQELGTLISRPCHSCSVSPQVGVVGIMRYNVDIAESAW